MGQSLKIGLKRQRTKYQIHSNEGGGGGHTVRCAKSQLFSTTGSHGSQGPEICTLQPLLVYQGSFFQSDASHGFQGPDFCTPSCFELIIHPSVGGWFSGVFLG